MNKPRVRLFTHGYYATVTVGTNWDCIVRGIREDERAFCFRVERLIERMTKERQHANG